MRPQVSSWTGGLRIGGDFFARRGAIVGDHPEPRGVVDRIADLANPGIDVTRVHPAVVAFFEDTVGLELFVRSRWRFPFSLAWRVARPVMRLIGQFVLPLAEGRIVTRALRLDSRRDGRPNARAIVRTYVESGEVMQAVAYATREHEGVCYMSAAFPLPGSHILGLLRLDAVGDDGPGTPLAVVLTSTARSGDLAGVWLVMGRVAIPSPFSERLSLWAPGMPSVPGDLDAARVPAATIVGRHEQRFFGIRFVTHDYWFSPTKVAP